MRIHHLVWKTSRTILSPKKSTSRKEKARKPLCTLKPAPFLGKEPSIAAVLPFCRPPHRHDPKRHSRKPPPQVWWDMPFTAYLVTHAVKDVPGHDEEWGGAQNQLFIIRSARGMSPSTARAGSTLAPHPALVNPSLTGVSRGGWRIRALCPPIPSRCLISSRGHSLRPFVK